MPITTVSVSFANGFVGNDVRNNEAGSAQYTSALGWSKLQFQQATDNGQFGGTQGNDLSGTILVTDAAGVQHRIDGVINWRAPSGSVSTVVFYATGGGHTLATANGGTYFIDPWTQANTDPHTFIGLTFNGQALTISNGSVSGNAATQGLLASMNTYLANQPKLTVGDTTINEGAATATVTVTLSQQSNDTVTVRYTTVDGTAVAGTDYTAATGTLTFAPGQTTKTITVPVTDTAAVDGTRTVSVILSDSSFAAITDNTGVVTITDNDSATPPVAATVASVVAEDGAHLGAMPVDSSVGEGGTLVYTVILSGTGGEHALARSGTAATADLGTLAFSDGVAWKNGNPASGIVVVPNGIGSFRITVPTADDTAIELAETVVLTVGGRAATGTITDNDSQAVASVIAEDAAHTGATPVDNAVIEGATLTYTVALNGTSPSAVEYTLGLGGTAAQQDLGSLSFSDGVAWKNGSAASGIVVVPAGVASFTVTLPTIDDALVENAESAVLTVGGVSATGMIVDNDSRSITAVVAEDAAHLNANPVDSTVVEGNTLRYTVSVSTAGVTDGEFALALTGSAATADLGAITFSNGVTWKNGDPATGVVVVPAAITSFTVDVATIDDALVESAETVVVTLGGIVAAGTVTDNDAPAIATVTAFNPLQPSSGATNVTEGAALAYAVTLNTAGFGTVEFALALGGTAAQQDVGSLSFSDGVAWKNGSAASGIVVVPAGVAAFTVTLPTIDDTVVEHPESAVLTVGGVSATGTIVDNDSRSITAIAAEDAAHLNANPVDSSVVEGTTLRYTVSVSAGVANDEYALVLSGGATAADLGALTFSHGVTWKNGDPGTGIVVIPAAVTSFTIDIATIDDALVEAAETVVVTLGGIVAAGTVTDNDAPAIASVTAFDPLQPSSGATSVTEGAALAYAVTLNTAAAGTVEFALALGGTAAQQDVGSLSFSDGVAWKNGSAASGIVVVPAGVAAFTVTLPTIDDALVENAESAVLTVGGVSATGTIADNDVVVTPPVTPVTPTTPETPTTPTTPTTPETPTTPTTPTTPETPTTPTTPVLQTGLDPASDDGSSQSDTVTSVITPEFTITGGALLATGGSVRLLSAAGDVVGTQAITAEDIATGKVNVGAGLLDDGVYTFTAQVLDADGNVVGTGPVSVTIVTDVDGVAPSIELAANGGDFNHDGVLDWQQHTVAQMPMRSLADFVLGKNASAASFGAVLAGSVTNAGEAVQLTNGAQLKDLSLTDLPAALPEQFRATSPVFNFTVTAEDGVASLPDLDAGRDGLQTRVVIDLAAGGSLATDFLKFDSATQTYYSFLDDGRLDTMDNGATLVDLNADGRVDRIVLTLTDGGWGDEDGLVNGTIVDPGMLAFDTPDNQVYSILLAGGDRYYTASAAEAAQKAAVAGNTFEGVAFDAQPGGQQMTAYYQPFTQDWTFAASGQALPYACYGAVAGAGGFTAAAAGSGTGTDFHLFQNARGATQLVTAAEAASLGLAAHGYTDRGAAFSATTSKAFDFDAEGYLVANQDNASVQALVQQLAASYQSSSAAGFVDAVEQNYLAQVTIVGVAHGAAATAAELNAAFGTGFTN